jgi:uncharacterized protein (TIRG00374 family)
VSGLLRLGPLFLGVALLASLAWSFGLEGLARALANPSPGALILYLLLTALSLLGYALRWRLVAGSLGSTIPLARLAGARLAGDVVGTIVPSGRVAGDPVRAAIVCAGGVEGTKATAGVVLDRVLEAIGNTVCAIVYVSVFSLTRGSSGGDALGTLVVVLAAALAALAAPLAMLRFGWRPLRPLYWLASERWGSWIAAARRTEDHLARLLRERPGVLLWGVLLSLATEAVVVAQYHFLLAGFAVHADLPTLLLVLVGSGLARATPTPAAIGTLEGGQVAVFALAKGAPALGFVTGLVIRIHEILLLLAGLVALSVYSMSLARLSSWRRSPGLPE